jgi:hypothetical protein
MGNRSDRRFANLSNSRALEAVEPIRTRRADFHQGPEHSNKAPYRGRIYDCNRLRLTPTRFAASTWDVQNQHATLGNSADSSGSMITFNSEVPKQFDDVAKYSTHGGLMQIMR